MESVYILCSQPGCQNTYKSENDSMGEAFKQGWFWDAKYFERGSEEPDQTSNWWCKDHGQNSAAKIINILHWTMFDAPEEKFTSHLHHKIRELLEQGYSRAIITIFLEGAFALAERQSRIVQSKGENEKAIFKYKDSDDILDILDALSGDCPQEWSL